MFHPSARRLDEPYKIHGFTIPQAVALALGGGGVIAALYTLHVGIQLGGFLATLVIGVPALWALLGESGRIEPVELAGDAIRHLTAPQRYEVGAGPDMAVLVIDVGADPPRRDRRVPWV